MIIGYFIYNNSKSSFELPENSEYISLAESNPAELYNPDVVASIAPVSSPISELQIEPEVIKVTKRKIGNIVQPISNVSAKTYDGEPKTETMSC